MKKMSTHPLHTIRCQHNLTITKLAEEAKIGASTIWRAEHSYPINAESRRRLCDYFGLTSQQLGLIHYTEQNISSDVRQGSFADQLLLQLESSLPTLKPMPAHQHIPDYGGSSEFSGSLNMQQTRYTQKPGVELLHSVGHLALLLDNRQNIDSMFDLLRVIFVGVQGLPTSLLYQIFASNEPHLHAVDHMMTQEERVRMAESLNKSIEQAWHFFHVSGSSQVFTVGQSLLYLVDRIHPLLPQDYCYSFHAAIYNLIGSALFSQGQYDVALRFHESAYKAAFDISDILNQAQSLNWQAIIAHAQQRYSDAIQLIEAALQLIEGNSHTEYQRLQAHLLADLAYNASFLGKRALAQEKLNASANFLKNLDPNEEFDQACWHQFAGDCMLLDRQYTPAIWHLERSLSQLPSHWLTRRVLTLIPLAKAYAFTQEKEASLATAKQAAIAMRTLDSTNLMQYFLEYLHLLEEIFPQDEQVHEFVMSIR
jgi:tetratricopeptide (TPR) repeat protein/transcriptional regulator with XRE-family HTH domain